MFTTTKKIDRVSYSIDSNVLEKFLEKTNKLGQTNRSFIIQKLMEWYVKNIDSNEEILKQSKKKRRGK